MNPALRTFIIRSVIACGIFLFFNISSSESVEEFLTWTSLDVAYFLFVYLVVLVVWGICDMLIQWYKRNYLSGSFHKRKLVGLFFLHFVVSLPVIMAATYFSAFHMKYLLNCPQDMIGDSRIVFLSETVQAVVISSLIIFGEILNLYYHHTAKIESEKAEMQTELLKSKYESLKNQVNPHFLFNSFSVLSSLIDHDQKLAGKFLGQLSKMYRYILDNRDHQLVDLSRELAFLDSYIFLLKTRHEDSIQVDTDIPEQFEDCQIPTLSLQMLIENAIKHNDFSHDEPLLISIRIENDYLVVQNRLNRKRAPLHSTRVGLENIRKRYCYKTNKSVVIQDDKEYFTVKLPVLLPNLSWN
jgi:sensor histidine kinase YesM